MKKIIVLQFFIIPLLAFSQINNVSIYPLTDVVDTIPKGQNFAAYNNLTNNSDSDVNELTFTWALSSDANFSGGDLVLDNRTTAISDPNNIIYPIVPGGDLYFWSSILNIPVSKTNGCDYYIVQKVEMAAGITETDYTDNFAYKKVCIRDQRIDLRAWRLSTSLKALFLGVNSNTITVNYSIQNYGELASGAFDYKILIGTDSDPTVGNLITVDKSASSLGASSHWDLSEEVDVSSLGLGSYHVFLQVDPANLLSEQIRSNNTESNTFEIITGISDPNYLLPSGDTVAYLATCNSTIYDNGGSDGDYLANTSSKLYVYPSESGKKIRIKIKQHDFESGDRIIPYYYVNPFIGYKALNIYTTTPIPVEYLSLEQNGIMRLDLNTNADNQNAGTEIEVSCVSSFDYRLSSLVPSKSDFLLPTESLTFSFKIENIGYSTISSLDYRYGISSTEDISDTLFLSDVQSSSSIAVNGSSTTSNIEIDLSQVTLPSDGEYFIFVASTSDENDSDLSDNSVVQSVNLTQIRKVEGGTRNFVNGESLNFSTCDLTLYDDGGVNGDYSNDFSGKVYLYPSDNQKLIKLTLNYDLEKKYIHPNYVFRDILTLNNPIDESRALNMPGFGPVTYVATNLPDGGVMIDFTSNSSDSRAGFTIDVGCVAVGTDYINDKIEIDIDTVVVGRDKELAFTSIVSNNGTTTGLSDLPFNLMISPTKDTSDAVYSSGMYNQTLKPETKSYYLWPSYEVTLDVSSVIEDGMYYLISVLDPENGIDELDESNNFAIDSFYVKVLQNGEIRVAFEDTVKGTSCTGNIYDYKGSSATTSLANTTGNWVVELSNPSPTTKFNITVNSFVTNSFNVKLYIYDRDSIADAPVATIYRGATMPVVYEAKNPGTPIEIVVNNNLRSSSLYYNLDISYNCGNDLITDIDNLTIKDESYLFPNPANDYVNIEMEGEKVVVNMLGEEFLRTSDKILDVSMLTSGYYYVIVRNGEEMTTLRFMKE